MATPWTDPTAHVYTVGELVSAATLNTYVQQDIASLGTYAAATRYYTATSNIASATAVNYFTALSVGSFPEAFTMIVKVSGNMVANQATAAAVTWGVTDEGGVSIVQGNAVMACPQEYRAFSVWGKKNYAANAAAGFNLTGLSTSAVSFSGGQFMEVTFVRGAV